MPFEDSFGLPTRDFLETDPERLMNRARVVAGPRPMDVVWPGRGGARTPYPEAGAGVDDWVTPQAPMASPPAPPPPTPPSTPPPQTTTPINTDDWVTPEEPPTPQPPEVSQGVTPPEPAGGMPLADVGRFTPPGGLGPDVATYGKPPGAEPQPVPAVAGLDLPPDYKFNTGGTALDKVLGPDTGMLTGPETFESKFGKPAREEVKGVPGLKDVPAQDRVMGSIAEAEDRLAIARDNLDAARGDAATRAENPVANAPFRKETRGRLATAERQVEKAQAAVDEARKRPLDTQTGARSKTETGVQNVGQFAVDTMAHVRGLLEVAAIREAEGAKAGGALLGDPKLADAYKKLAADLGKFEDETQSLVDRSARPDRAKAEDFDTKLTAGAVSMGIFMAGGVAARAIGVSSAMGSGGMGALQMGGAALREVEDEAKKVSADIDGLKARGLDTTKEEARLKELLGAKYVALFANSALGATEAIPIERFLERLNAVPGATQNRIGYILANTAKQSIEEVLQEVGQQIGQHVVAKVLWDHSREIFGKDVTESGEIAAILGAVMGGGAGTRGAMRGDHLHGHGLPTPPPAAPLDTDLTPVGPAPTSAGPPVNERTPAPPPTPQPPGAGTTSVTPPIPPPQTPPVNAAAPPGAAASDAADITDVEHAIAAPAAPVEGTRKAPIEIKSDADIERIGDVVRQDHTAAQGEAHNVQHEHADWHGFGVTIEAPAGGIRRGTAPDGTPFEQTFAHPYGYLKGTKGADGQAVDAYLLGAEPQAFVLDELDETGKFRQHKVFLGAADSESAREAYLGTQGKKPEQWGGGRMMSADELKDWSAGDMTAPVLTDRNRQSGEERNKVLRAYGYTQIQIDRMGEKERVKEFYDAVQSGVKAEDFKPTTTSAPSNEGAKSDTSQEGEVDRPFGPGKPAPGAAILSQLDAERERISSSRAEPAPEDVAAIDDAMRASGEDPKAAEFKEMAKRGADLYAQHSAKGLSHADALRASVAESMIDSGLLTEDQARQHYGPKVLELLQTERGTERGVREQAGQSPAVGANAAHAQGTENGGQAGQAAASRPVSEAHGTVGQATAAGDTAGGRGNLEQGAAAARREQTAEARNPDGFFDRPQEDLAPKSESKEAQYVIPGAERISMKEHLERKAREPKRAPKRGSRVKSRVKEIEANGGEPPSAPSAPSAPKPPRAPPPMSAMTYIASRGGLSSHVPGKSGGKPVLNAELKKIGLSYRTRVVAPGMGWRNVLRKDGGMTMDEAREALIEGKYLPNDRDNAPSDADAHRKIYEILSEEHNHKRPTFPQGEENADVEDRARRAAQDGEDEIDVYEQAVRDAVKETDTFRYITSPDHYFRRAATIMAIEGMSAEDAWLAAVEREHLEDGLVTADELIDIYDLGDLDGLYPKTPAAPANVATNGAEGVSGNEPRAESQAEGRGGRGEGVSEDRETPGSQQEPVAETKVPVPSTEKTAAGEQAVLPGTEKISKAEEAQRKTDKPLKPKAAQRPMDEGLFGDGHKQLDLVEMAAKEPAATKPEKAPELSTEPSAKPAEDIQKLSPNPAGNDSIPQSAANSYAPGITEAEATRKLEEARQHANRLQTTLDKMVARLENPLKAKNSLDQLRLDENRKISERNKTNLVKRAAEAWDAVEDAVKVKNAAIAAATHKSTHKAPPLAAINEIAKPNQEVDAGEIPAFLRRNKSGEKSGETTETSKSSTERIETQPRTDEQEAADIWGDLLGEPAKPELPEHPGLVVKSLETGKTTEIQPKGTRPPKAKVAKQDQQTSLTDRPTEKIYAPLQSDLTGRVPHQAVVERINEMMKDGMSSEEAQAKIAAMIRAAENPTERTAGEAAKSAVKNVSRGTSAAVEGLFQLFNTKNTLGVGITLDEETWKKAKPFFIQATKDFSGAFKDMREFAQKLFEALTARGLHIDDMKKMRPYLEHFTVQVKRGEIDLNAEPQAPTSESEVSNERTGPEEGNSGEPNQVPAEGGRGNGSEGDTGRGHAGAGDRGTVGNGSSNAAGVQGARGEGSGPSGVSKTAGGGRRSGLGAGRTGANGKRVPRKSPGGDGRGRKPGPGPVAPEQVPSLPAINFKINDEVHLGEGGEKVKLNANVFAIQVLKDIERENRRATPDEQNVLSRYVGWGGLANAFRQPETNEFKPEWKERGEELEAVLTKEELRAARSSTQYAHYTSRTVIDAMWNAVKHLGFNGGIAVETSAGVGNFLGLIPDDIAGSTKFVAVEKDGISARIAKLLYPQETVLHAPFEAVPLPDGEAALVIGNPPFSQHSLMFQNKPELTGMSMHNQFLLAGLDALRPGGVQAVVVSRYVMDSMDTKAREMMAIKADLIGAIRLPDTAFKENANTDVVTDILFFQRRTKAEESKIQDIIDSAKSAKAKGKDNVISRTFREVVKGTPPSWIETTDVRDPLGGAPMRVNQYFASNPRAVMGQLERSGTMQMSTEEGKGVNVRLEIPKIEGETVEARRRRADRELASRLAGATAKLKIPTDAGLQHDVLAASLARHEAMSESLSIALAGSEVGHVERNVDGKLTQVTERETPSGDYELTRRVLSPASPWSRELSMDKDGRWYVMEPRSLVDAIDERVATLQDRIKAYDANQDVSLAHAARNELVQLQSQRANAKPGELAKDGKRNIYARKFFPNNEVPTSMRLGDSKYERLVEAVSLRDLTKRQLTIEAEDAPAAQMEDNRRKLARAYEGFVGRHGLINDPRNMALINDLPDGAVVMALEFDYRPAVTNTKAARSGEKARPASATPAPILSRRVVPKYEPATSADSAADAVSIVLSESGRLDMERIAALLGTDEASAIAKLTEGEKPLAYLDPETKTYEPRNAYLSGQVAKKLAAARVAGLTKNAEDLKAVLPERWTAENVTAIIGNNWIPPEVYANFANHLLGTTATAHYSKATNAFALYVGSYERERQDQWGTPDMPADAILRGMLNSKVPKVLDPPDDNGTRRVNQELSTLVMMKAREIENEFADWVFRDGDRRNQLVDIYNDKFNTRVTRQHDGSHMTLPGKVPDEVIKLRRHQKNAVWRGVYERFMLLDHVVGAGKTIVAIARAMERRRMGLSRKPMIAVPNHLVDQWVQDIYKLYPGAKVLAAGRNQFDRKNRRRLFARIATGDWDIVVVPHSSFGFIGIDPATELRFLEQDLKLAVDAVREAKEQAASEGTGGRSKPFTVKEAEKLVETITARMAKLKLGNKDRMLTFEQMGVDDLTIDESHEYKNLFFSSRLTGVRGMGDKAGSKKAFDLYNKVRTLRESPNGTVTFMTGTPISNSAVEMFTILRYLAANDLKDLGLEHFDAWRSQYVSAQPAFEPTEAGGLKEVTRLGRSWSNMRSLMELYYSFTDAVSQDDINKWHAEDNNGARFPVPRVKGGGRQEVVVKPTPAQLDELGGIVAGFNMLPDISDPRERNIARLQLMDRARKVSLDVRAANKMSDSKEEGGKLDQIADQVTRIHKAWAADKGTQLIFLDRGVKAGKSDGKRVKEYDELVAKRDAALAANDEDLYRKLTDKLDEYDPNEMKELRIALQGGWNAYDQLKENLIKRGVPASEIRFVQEANSDAEKRALFDLVREGSVRVLIGSTPKMGAGTNVQRRLVALHHADVTWKPSDIEQREGRIIRQSDGNPTSLMTKYGDKFEVEILAYATERTVDAKMWDLNSQKLRTINGIRKYNGEFNMEFEDEDAVGMAEIAALASGDPLLLERVKLISQLDKFEMLDRAFRRRMFGIDDRIQSMERAQRDYPAMIKAGVKKAEIIKQGFRAMQTRAENRAVTVDGKKYDSMTAAVKAATDAIELQNGGEENARYAITVDGQRLTNKAGIQEAIENALGDVSAFEVEANGEIWRRRSQLAKEISTIATKAIAGFSGDEGRVASHIGKMGGFDLNTDVNRGRWGDVVSLWIEHDGIVLADSEKTVERGKTKQDVSTQLARSIIDNLADRARTEAGFSGDYLQGMIDEANAKLPTIKKERAEAKFPQAEEMAATRKRLEEVIRTLDERTKAEESRGGRAAPSPEDAATEPPSTLNQPGSMFSLNREYNVVHDANGKIIAKPAYVFEPRDSLPLGMQAQHHVMRRGIVTGMEHLVAIDENGAVVNSVLGNEQRVTLPNSLQDALEDPTKSIVVHHNHPNNFGLSDQDLGMLGNQGMSSLWAHGHRGFVARAALTPRARRILGRLTNQEARAKIKSAAQEASSQLYWMLRERVRAGQITDTQANLIDAHATALVLHTAGIIDYQWTRTGRDQTDTLLSQVPNIEGLIRQLAYEAGRSVLNDNVAGTTTEVRQPLSHPGEVGTAFENARSRPEEHGNRLGYQTGKVDNPADQNANPNALTFEARPPKRFRRAGTGTPPLPMPHFTPLHTNWRAALRDPTLSLTERYEAALGALFLPAARKFWDKLIDLARMQRAAEIFNGAKTPQRLDAHIAAILYPGITGERLKDASWDLFRPIYDAMKAHNVSPEEVQDYLYARHAEERNMVVGAINQPSHQFRLAMTDHSQVGASGMSTDEANSILAHVAMRQSDFDAVAALVDAVNAHNQNLMETEGLEHLSTLMTWNRAYQHYVPLRGEEVGSEDEHGSPPLGTGFSTRGPESMRALGRGSRAGSILAHLLDQTNRLIIRAEKNKVGKTFARWAIANPNPDLYKVGLGTVRRAVNPSTGMVELEWVPTPAQSERAFAFKVAGDTHYIEFAEGQEGMLLALKNLGIPRFGALMRTAQWMTRTWSSFQTAKDPEFVTNNFLRDIQEAGLAITAEQQAGFQAAYWKNLTKGRSFLAAVMGQVGATGNRYGQLYEDWRHDGGKISSFGWKDVDTIVKDIQREMTRRTESMAWKVAAQPWRTIDPVNGHIVHLFEALNDIMESTTRLAVYAAGRDIGLTRAVSAAAARAMTVDFSRGGEAKGTIQALYAFANPAIQGQVNLVRRLKSRHFRYIYGVGIPSAAFMLTLYNLWASGSDDDDEKKRTYYEEMKQWERDSNIVVFLPGAKDAKKISLNFMAKPAWALGENAAMAMMGKIKPGAAIGNFLGSTAQAFNPLGSAGSAFDLRTWAKTIAPTMLDPIIELGFNRDWLNRPIHPDEASWNRGIPHSQQSKMTTSHHAEDAAQGLNRLTGGSAFSKGSFLGIPTDLYPDDLEYAWNFMLGGYGKFVLRGADLIRDKIDGVDTPVEKIPFVRRFITEGGSENQKRETYYEKHHEADERSQQVRNAIRAERVGKNVEEAQRTIDELGDKVGARVTGTRNGVPSVSTRAETAFRDADHKLTKLRVEERELRRDRNMNRVERMQQIKTNRKEQLDIMRDARDRYQSVAQP